MPLPACPKCRNSGEVFYSRTTSAERALGLLRVFPFRCVACSQRFFRFAEPQLPETAHHQDLLPSTAAFHMPPQPSPLQGDVELLEAAALPTSEPRKETKHEQAVSWQVVAEGALAAAPSLSRSPSPLALAANNPHWFLALEPAAPFAATPDVTDIVASDFTVAAAAPEIAAAREPEESLDGLESPRTPIETDGPAFWAKDEVRWTLRGCAILLTLQIAIGVIEGPSLGLTAMWVNLITVKSLVAAGIVFLFLRHTNAERHEAAWATARVTGTWVALFFVVDVCVLKGVLPLFQQTPGSGSAFRAQAPWIWLSYALIPLAGVLGFSGYTWSCDQLED